MKDAQFCEKDKLINDVMTGSVSGGRSQIFCNSDGFCGVCGCGPDICGVGCGMDCNYDRGE